MRSVLERIHPLAASKGNDMSNQELSDSGRQRTVVWLVVGAIALLALAAVLALGSMGLFGSVSSEEDAAAELTQLEPFSDDTDQPAEQGEASSLPEPGDIAPDFTLADVDGNEVTLADFRGRPVMLNFWATWCAPCRLEMPEMEQAQQDYAADGLAILAINQEEPAERVAAFMDELGLTFSAPLDVDGDVAAQYGAFFLPSSVFINADGEVTAFHRGIIARSQIDDYLAETIAN